MTTPTEAFFERLSHVGHDPRLANVKGVVRFELVDGATTQVWHVAVLRGDIAVSGADGDPADAVFRAPRELFDQIATGEANSMTARLRGAIHYEGDPQFAVLFRRLFGNPATPAAAPLTEASDRSPTEPRMTASGHGSRRGKGGQS